MEPIKTLRNMKKFIFSSFAGGLAALTLSSVSVHGLDLQAHVSSSAPVAPTNAVGYDYTFNCHDFGINFQDHPELNCWFITVGWPAIPNDDSTRYSIRWTWQGSGWPISNLRRVTYTCGEPALDFGYSNSDNVEVTRVSSVQVVPSLNIHNGAVACTFISNNDSPFRFFGTNWEIQAINSAGASDWQPLQIVNNAMPVVRHLAAKTSPSTIKVTWSPPAVNSFSQIIVPTGFYNVTLRSPSGTTLSCRTILLQCSFSELVTTQAYAASVSVETEQGSMGPNSLGYLVYPVNSSRLKVVTPSPTFKRTLVALAYGVAPGSKVIVGVPGKRSACTANAAGQCTVRFTTKPGTWNILAQRGSKTATTKAWYPSVKLPARSRRGESFNLGITSAPPKVAVVLTLSDGRTINATTGGSGAVHLNISTPMAAFLTVGVSIAGIGFGLFDVQVS